MLDKFMQISMELDEKIERSYFFIKGHIDINCDYFIEKIKRGVEENGNMSHKTNLEGKMTSWNYFNNDENFRKYIINFNRHMDKNYKLPFYALEDSWGFINSPGDKTKYHSHYKSIYSGVIYLNHCAQPLLFNEIKQKIVPEPGSFAIFSSWLTHGCDINDTNINKFGISFNMSESNRW
tara:strand:+ start:1068 stop:1604 length:537 start_codon:yes stop_codon:yes gene_type:complete